jgi:hypothetical protein
MRNITFIDSIGRTILAEEINRTDTSLVVKNPAMINVAQAQNGQLQVQLIPLFFAEFVDSATRPDGTQWTYNLNTVTLGEVSIDSRLVEQYGRVFSVAGNPAPETSGGESVVKLFDE